MASFTVAFSGTSSTLRADFFPEIVLDPNAEYECALLDFNAYNTITNIVENVNDSFKFKSLKKRTQLNENTLQNEEIVEETELEIVLPTGAYEVEEILKYLKWELDVYKISFTFEISAASSSVAIEFDTQIEWIGGTLLNVIGFHSLGSFESGVSYRSETTVKIVHIDLIRIECDIVSGSYINGKQSHTLHQFSHCKVAPGYKFIEVPQNLIYLPVRDRELQSIELTIVDQNGNLIDFRGEEINCRIHIKKV